MAPRWLDLAKGQIGTKEIPGPKSNKAVLAYYKEAGAPVQSDAVPWCAAFVGAMLKRAGIEPTGSLMARSYLGWGTPLKAPKPGCVVVFARGRPPSGHVGFFDGFTSKGMLRIVGGNQSDAVSIANYPANRVLGYRWPREKGMPK